MWCGFIWCGCECVSLYKDTSVLKRCVIVWLFLLGERTWGWPNGNLIFNFYFLFLVIFVLSKGALVNLIWE